MGVWKYALFVACLFFVLSAEASRDAEAESAQVEDTQEQEQLTQTETSEGQSEYPVGALPLAPPLLTDPNAPPASLPPTTPPVDPSPPLDLNPPPPPPPPAAPAPPPLVMGEPFPGGSDKRTPGKVIAAGKGWGSLDPHREEPAPAPIAPSAPLPKLPVIVLRPPTLPKPPPTPVIGPRRPLKKVVTIGRKPNKASGGGRDGLENDLAADVLGISKKSIRDAVAKKAAAHGGNLPSDTVNHNVGSTLKDRVYLVPDLSFPPGQGEFPFVVDSNYTYPEGRRFHRFFHSKRHPPRARFPRANFTIPEFRNTPKRYTGHGFLGKHKHLNPWKYFANYTSPEIRVPLKGVAKVPFVPAKLQVLALNYSVVPEYKPTFIPVTRTMSAKRITKAVEQAKKAIQRTADADKKVDRNLAHTREAIRELMKHSDRLHRRHIAGWRGYQKGAPDLDAIRHRHGRRHLELETLPHAHPPWVILPAQPTPKVLAKRIKKVRKRHERLHREELKKASEAMRVVQQQIMDHIAAEGNHH